jgi:prohibitin 2
LFFMSVSSFSAGKAAAALVAGALLISVSSSFFVIEPGYRGIRVTLGRASERPVPEGFGMKLPVVTSVIPVSIKQRTATVRADCFSSDLQQVVVDLRVMYRVPEDSVVEVYRQFAGDPFDGLIAPRVQEALKEVTALHTAEQIVKQRGEIKDKALAAARTKVGETLHLEDVVLKNIVLSNELERAIEAKMVAEQQAEQARFTQVQTQVEAETAIIRARGEAEAIKARGEALRLNPGFVTLQMVERWNGKSPVVVPKDSAGGATSVILPVGSTGAGSVQ